MAKPFWLLLTALALPGLALATDQPAPTAAVLEPPGVTAAPIALLADLSSGQVLYARAANQRFLPASMTKAMTALVAFDLIKAGKLHEDALIKVQPETAARWAGKGTTLNLRGGEKVNVHDLLMGTTTVSANDAAIVLAEGALGSLGNWTAAMNARAAALGMTDSHFASANGFPGHGRTYVTANDLVRLAMALIEDHPALYHSYFGHQAMVWRGATLRSHDPFAGVLPGADGIKTGHSFEAGFNFLGSVSRAFLAPGYVVGMAKVQGGAARSVTLGVPRAFALSLPKGLPAQVTGQIKYNGPLQAPFAKGQQVASLEIHIAGQPVHTLPLVPLSAVESARPIDRIVNGLLGLFS